MWDTYGSFLCKVGQRSNLLVPDPSPYLSYFASVTLQPWNGARNPTRQNHYVLGGIFSTKKKVINMLIFVLIAQGTLDANTDLLCGNRNCIVNSKQNKVEVHRNWISPSLQHNSLFKLLICILVFLGMVM